MIPRIPEDFSTGLIDRDLFEVMGLEQPRPRSVPAGFGTSQGVQT